MQLKKEHDEERKKLREEMKKRKKEMEGSQEEKPITWMGQTSLALEGSDFIQEDPPKLETAHSEPVKDKVEIVATGQDVKAKTKKEPVTESKSSKDKVRPSLSEFKKQMKMEIGSKEGAGVPGVEIYVKEDHLHEVNKRRQMLEEQSKKMGNEETSKTIDFELTDEEGSVEDGDAEGQEEMKEEIKVEENEEESEGEEHLQD